ncbi:FAD/NAD(P)-binding oxidoreductase family protein [Zea mays]|uniref:FAD/NAD(P)-binding oxidoreductase family protein n=1 Tax=Zea mays TaxID=4577 RepID=A0A1D6KFC9_MAIZE|nr:FAD/NAD(P)-binding oxidoreductase family protein [Zea mays]
MPPSPIVLPATALPAARLARVVAASESGGATPPRASPRRGRRGKPGFSRRSAIKKSFHQEQVVFSTPVSTDPTVAVIGGGASGLSCATSLAARGVRSVVFDTGMHGLGGRMATRFVDGGKQLVFDHAAQFFTASDERFQRLVNEWLDRGLVREWSGLIGELEAGGCFRPIPSLTPRYIGVNGMRPLADAMLPEVYLISSTFFKLHGRKCANRLLSTSGLPLLTKQMKVPWFYYCNNFLTHEAYILLFLLLTKFPAVNDQRLELSSVWALLAAFEDPLPIPLLDSNAAFEGAFVRDVDSLSWMGNNTRKLFPMQTGAPECWTFFSTAAYGKRNKVPQENIPKLTAEKVKEDMLGGVEHALGLSEGSLQQPIYTRVQLWGAALPMNTPGVPCIFDPLGRAGICGDWLTGSSIEAAVLSGMSLANHIADYFVSTQDRPEEFAIGVHDDLNAVEGHDIGQFPGLDTQTPQVAEAQLTPSI